MCGICGFVSKQKTSADLAQTIRSMSRAIAHRGPDGEGVCLFDEQKIQACYTDHTTSDVVSRLGEKAISLESTSTSSFKGALSHRRLSIIETGPEGHQPFGSQDYQITFNGEIYNYIELRDELAGLGCSFQTSSDTEVLLQAYLQWGEKCLDKLDGMFAFVILDLPQRKLFGARDRIGVKPFYYVDNKEVFAFASEQKSLLRIPELNVEINPQAVFEYFAFGQIEREEESFYQGIKELFPGHCFSYDLVSGKLDIDRYYQLEVEKQFRFQGDLAQTIEEIKETLYASISRRMRSDVPIGACLSGGVDSSVIVGVMNEVRKQQGIKDPFSVFTATFPQQQQIDESSWAEYVVKQSNVEWHQVTPTSDELRKDLEDLLYCQDIPIWSTSTYAQWRVMKLVADTGIKVVLDGQGGDEVFGGYKYYYPSYWKQARQAGIKGSWVPEGWTKKERWAYYTRQMAREKWVPSAGKLFKVKALEKFNSELSYLNSDFLQEGYQKWLSHWEEKPVLFNERLAYDMNNRTLKSYLKCEDRCGMWHGVEARTPFSDSVDLINLLYSLSGEIKVKNGQLKYLLLEAGKSYLPREIYERKDKKGYNTPNNQWIAEQRNAFRSYFENGPSDFLNRSKVLDNYEALFNHPNQEENGRLFRLIAFSAWENILKKAKV